MTETSANSMNPRIEAALHEYFDQLDRGEAVERETFLRSIPRSPTPCGIL